MPIIRPATKSLSTILALTISLFSFGCGGGSGSSGGGGNTPPSTPSTANEWTWVSGSNVGNAKGVYGTQGVPAATNVPGARDSAVTWTDGSGNFWLYGGSGNDLWKFSPTTNMWTWVSGSDTVGSVPAVYGTLGVAAASNTPGYRSQAASWIDTSGNLWLFGGDQYTDLWEFSPTTNEWTWVSGSNTSGAAIYGTQGVVAASNTPGYRSQAASWIDKSGNFWLFGGNGVGGYINDLWELNPTAKTWTWISGSNTANHTGVYGTLGTPAATNVPGARGGVVSWTDGSGNFWLFGGYGNDSTSTQGSLNDLWEFNPTAKTWTWMSGSNTANAVGVYGAQGVASASNVPGARGYAVSWIDPSGNLWLFGGIPGYLGIYSFKYDLNDLWEFSPTNKEWTWVSGTNTIPTGSYGQSGVYGTQGVAAASNVPGARDSAVSWVDSSGNLWLFGGSGYDSTGALVGLNDLWRYQP